MARKIAVIGGGIAGLSTGCYGRMNGYETEIFEMHTVPGGVCTGWARRGYTFDGCLHFLVGTAAGNSFHRVWQELGALSGKRIVAHEVFGDVVLPDGRKLRQYADVDRMVRSLKAALPGLTPRDCARLDQLAADVKLWGTLKMPFGGPPRGTSLAAKLRGMWKIRAFLPVFHRFRGTTETLAARFRHPDLRCFFRSVNPIPGMPAIVSLMMFTVLHLKEAGWPGGRIARACPVRCPALRRARRRDPLRRPGAGDHRSRRAGRRRTPGGRQRAFRRRGDQRGGRPCHPLRNAQGRIHQPGDEGSVSPAPAVHASHAGIPRRETGPVRHGAAAPLNGASGPRASVRPHRGALGPSQQLRIRPDDGARRQERDHRCLPQPVESLGRPRGEPRCLPRGKGPDP